MTEFSIKANRGGKKPAQKAPKKSKINPKAHTTERHKPIAGFESYTPSHVSLTIGNLRGKFKRAYDLSELAYKLMEELEKNHNTQAQQRVQKSAAATEDAQEIANAAIAQYMRGGAISAAAIVCLHNQGKISQCLEKSYEILNKYSEVCINLYAELQLGESRGKKGEDLLNERAQKLFVMSDQLMVNCLFMVGFAQQLAFNAASTAMPFSKEIRGKLEEEQRKMDAEDQADMEQLRNMQHSKTIIIN